MGTKFSEKNIKINFILLLVLIVLFLCLSWFVRIEEDAYKSFLANFPPVLSWIIFIVLYVVVSFFIWLGPKDLFRFAAAFLYGLYLSTALVYIAEMINLVILFFMSRKLGRAFVEKKTGGKIKKIDQMLAEESFLGIFFLRFFPIVPLRFLDLGFGLTKISLKKYFVISLVASPLRIFLGQFVLSLGLEIALNPVKLSQYLTENPSVRVFCFLYVAGALIMIVIMKRRVARRKRLSSPD